KAQWLAEQIAEGRQHAAVRGKDRRARAPLGPGELAGVGQGEGKIAQGAAADDCRPQQQQDAEPRQSSKNPSASTRPSRPAAGRPANAVRRVSPQPRFSHAGGSASSKIHRRGTEDTENNKISALSQSPGGHAKTAA